MREREDGRLGFSLLLPSVRDDNDESGRSSGRHLILLPVFFVLDRPLDPPFVTITTVSTSGKGLVLLDCPLSLCLSFFVPPAPKMVCRRRLGKKALHLLVVSVS